MDKLDRFCKLLGTALVKVAFVDHKTGAYLQDDSPGRIQLDILHGGVYDVKYNSSPYLISELLIGFTPSFGGFAASTKPQELKFSKKQVEVNQIVWSHDSQLLQTTVEGKLQEKTQPNPYKVIPAVPFFNSDPAHYYFLPVNEPLLYANHAVNMRLTDLNHIAKFQSFGVPVMTGVERGTSVRRGKPVDDFNYFKSGSPLRGGANSPGGYGTSGLARNFLAENHSDGNADANALGVSIGPDTAIAMGEKGDFKFASPNADIQGLAKTIQHMQDWVRISHGLQAKGNLDVPGKESGFSKMVSKIGVLEENIRRQKLFKEREQQLFEVIKIMWNTHYKEVGDDKFSDNAVLDITYVEPQFPLDPQTKIALIEGERKIIESGDTRAIKELFKHLDDIQVKEILEQHQKDRLEQLNRELELVEVESTKMEELGIEYSSSSTSSSSMVKAPGMGKQPGVDNKVKQSVDSSKQKAKNMDTRKQQKEKKAEKPQGKDAKEE